MNQKGNVVLVVLLIALAVIGGSLIYKKQVVDKDLAPNYGYPSYKSPVPTSTLTPSPSLKCGDSNPIIKPSTNKDWSVFTGKLFNNPCKTPFSIEYPSKWQQVGYNLYPFGKTNLNQTPQISLQVLGHGWYHELKIVTKTFPAGTADYSWGRPNDENYIVGFANINGFIAEVKNIPLDKDQELQVIFDQMLSTFKFQ